MKVIALGFLLGTWTSLSWAQQQVAMSTPTPKTYEVLLNNILILDSDEVDGKFRESGNTLNLRLSWKDKKEPGWRKILPFF